MEFPEAKIGDLVEYHEDYEDHLTWFDGDTPTQFRIMGIERRDEGAIEHYLLDMSEYGNRCGAWDFDESNLADCADGREELKTRLLAGENIKGWWIRPRHIGKIIPGKGYKGKVVCKGYFPPVINENHEQLRKDVSSFFKDLAEPWESPKKNGFEFL